jgi:choline kinase
MAKRLSGRASVTPSSLLGFSGSPKPIGGEDGSGSEMQNDPHSKLVIQIMAWLVEEKAKQALRRKKSAEDSGSSAQHVRDDGRREANPSILSEPDAEYSLKKLEQIVSESIEYARKFGPRPSADFQGYNFPRRKSSAKLLRKGSTVPTASSDTDYQDGDAIVPSADVILDNSKTLSYSGGGANTDPDLTSDKALRSQEGWNTFKYEIVRLTHTLRLKGWRRVSLDLSSSIEVTRLSGALTNAVYVVSPPKDLPATTPSGDGDKAPSLKRNPP